MTGINAPRLVDLGTRILVALGVPEADARLVSDSLVTADMWGHASHGMLRLPWYAARLRSGAMNSVTAPQTVLDNGALAVLDGRDGIGQIITNLACEEAVRRAGVHGVGVVAVRNSNHFGTAAYWTKRMTRAGCVGILTTNSSPAMAPWGGMKKTVGANPWSIATPGGSHTPVVLDISNTSVARGKIYSALQKKQGIPLGWAIDQDGQPTTDPQSALDGIMLPVGEHKGYGISFMMDILSGVLTGSSYATGVTGPYIADQKSGCGHLVIALKIDTMVGDAVFGAGIDDLIESTKAVPLAHGVSEIYYPGEIEARAEEAAQTSGVALPEKTLADLRDLAASAGVEFRLDEE
ncbi:Ldh family oxidoreductase [Cryobacterium sp. Y50]|uniref:Ldh family oxidoreductase n=1 Tax=Cryobacterium sp. Y50 TaxID=2048286 RepID=UPI000CE3390C|nr:Ldh family oxidoreductase [Cryobacterium sp. Y50]